MASFISFAHDVFTGLLLALAVTLIAWLAGYAAACTRQAFRGEIRMSTTIVFGALALLAHWAWKATA